MSFLANYAADTEENNIILQRVLRDIDNHNFLAFMSGLAENERAIIYRNLSKRAAEALLADLSEKNGFYRQATVEYSTGVFERMLARQVRYQKARAEAAQGWQEPDGSPERTRDLLLYLAVTADDNRFRELKAHEAACKDPMFKLALRVLHDNTDPLAARSLLEQMKKALLRSYEQHLDLIIEGSDSILNSEAFGKTQERLDAMLGRV